MLDVICDAADEGVLGDVNGRLGMRVEGGVESMDGHSWGTYRLARSPDSYRYPDPPPGTYLSRSPDGGWPREWLLPLGVTDESLALRGATHTIAELVAAAAGGPVTATIRGRVVSGSGGAGYWNPLVDDGTARIVVACERRTVPISIGVGSDGEFDVVLESAAAPEPIVDDDPEFAAIANRLRPSVPTALARGARAVPKAD